VSSTRVAVPRAIAGRRRALPCASSASENLRIAQEFTPTFNSLNFVDLYIGDAGGDIGPGASFKVVIHSGSITGTVLGTSNTAFVPDNTKLGVGAAGVVVGLLRREHTKTETGDGRDATSM
jgi:hypothetical protein